MLGEQFEGRIPRTLNWLLLVRICRKQMICVVKNFQHLPIHRSKRINIFGKSFDNLKRDVGPWFQLMALFATSQNPITHFEILDVGFAFY